MKLKHIQIRHQNKVILRRFFKSLYRKIIHRGKVIKQYSSAFMKESQIWIHILQFNYTLDDRQKTIDNVVKFENPNKTNFTSSTIDNIMWNFSRPTVEVQLFIRPQFHLIVIEGYEQFLHDELLQSIRSGFYFAMTELTRFDEEFDFFSKKHFSHVQIGCFGYFNDSHHDFDLLGSSAFLFEMFSDSLDEELLFFVDVFSKELQTGSDDFMFQRICGEMTQSQLFLKWIFLQYSVDQLHKYLLKLLTLISDYSKQSNYDSSLFYFLIEACSIIIQTYFFCQFKFANQPHLNPIRETNQIYRFKFILIQYLQTMEKDQPQKPTSNEQGKSKLVNNYKEQKNKKHPDRKLLKYYEDLLRPHQYWDYKPTLREDKEQPPGSVEGLRKVEDVSKEPLKLPTENLHWVQIDVNNNLELDEFYHLLTNNYVQDDDSTYRFDYSRQFLNWALTPPGYRPQWLVGIRNEKKQLVGSITGVPVTVLVQKDKIKMAEINFLCVHKNYRVNKLAALLISEVTRRVNLRDKWQAIYTSGKNLPTPFTRATYYHRSLNPKKLIEVKFSALGPNQTMVMVKKLYSLPEETTLKELRPMTKNDIFGVAKLLNEGLQKFVVKFHYTDEEVKHFFLPRDKIVYTYVISKTQVAENGKKKVKVTDFLSFYSLPSHVMKNPKHNMLYACYSFYNFASSVSYSELIRNALILAKNQGFDVYNCLNLMDNPSVFQDLHFQMGDGKLNYYLYNWIMNSRKIEPSQLGVVLF